MLLLLSALEVELAEVVVVGLLGLHLPQRIEEETASHVDVSWFVQDCVDDHLL